MSHIPLPYQFLCKCSANSHQTTQMQKSLKRRSGSLFFTARGHCGAQLITICSQSHAHPQAYKFFNLAQAAAEGAAEAASADAKEAALEAACHSSCRRSCLRSSLRSCRRSCLRSCLLPQIDLCGQTGRAVFFFSKKGFSIVFLRLYIIGVYPGDRS